MKHKHYDCIVAWAEGKQIQFRFRKHPSDPWMELPKGGNHGWHEEIEYRVKPELKPDIVRYARARFTEYQVKCFVSSEANERDTKTFWTKQQAANDNIKATFDGETGKLKSVELI